MFDTHAHLDDDRFAGDLDEVLERAWNVGVRRLIQASSDLESSRASCLLASRPRPDAGHRTPDIWCTVGIHPHDASSADAAAFEGLRALLDGPAGARIVAIGEIGLDYHYDLSPRDAQREAFRSQLELAAAYGLPVVIHERDALEDCMSVLRSFGVAPGRTAGLGGRRGIPGAFHCFSGSVETARELIAMGFYLGFDGPVTFRNARKAPDVIRAVPRDRLLIETDSPYLAPEPHRGRRNEPAYVIEVARRFGELLGCSLDEAAELTWDNACRLFGTDGMEQPEMPENTRDDNEIAR